ncbi:DnaJ domain-containing protein [Desulfocurvibacter africanus]|uniref:DnaJ domain-containing protein n=1 Tax=Desulfocurvibacter africanus TaxID=873 RepID=UPI000411A7E5|nr:DnaJ domain-containing protein [Desulfocurvibacter africanus]
MTVKECYQILHVSPEANLEEVKRSFRKLAFDLHPDLHPDDPSAARKFQRLNEAYIFLRKTMESADFSQESPEQTAKNGAASQNAGAQGRAHAQGGNRNQAQTGSRPFRQGPPPGAPSAEERARERMRKKHSDNERFFSRKEEVLQDILKDPFARKVFEDIYQQVRNGNTTPKAAPKEIRKRKIELEWGKRKISIDLSKGLIGSFKAWMQGQMDVHKIIHLPLEQLMPGRTVRITFSPGLSTKKHAIEIRLPGDFAVGKAMRLRGLGRKIGALQGDMYLRILAK